MLNGCAARYGPAADGAHVFLRKEPAVCVAPFMQCRVHFSSGSINRLKTVGMLGPYLRSHQLPVGLTPTCIFHAPARTAIRPVSAAIANSFHIVKLPCTRLLLWRVSSSEPDQDTKSARLAFHFARCPVFLIASKADRHGTCRGWVRCWLQDCPPQGVPDDTKASSGYVVISAGLCRCATSLWLCGQSPSPYRGHSQGWSHKHPICHAAPTANSCAMEVNCISMETATGCPKWVELCYPGDGIGSQITTPPDMPRALNS